MDAISFQNCPRKLRKLRAVWHPTTEKHACRPKHHAARVSSLVANSAGPGQIWISICNIAVDFRMGTNETGKRVRAIAIDQKSVKMPVPFCGPKWMFSIIQCPIIKETVETLSRNCVPCKGSPF